MFFFLSTLPWRTMANKYTASSKTVCPEKTSAFQLLRSQRGSVSLRPARFPAVFSSNSAGQFPPKDHTLQRVSQCPIEENSPGQGGRRLSGSFWAPHNQGSASAVSRGRPHTIPGWGSAGTRRCARTRGPLPAAPESRSRCESSNFRAGWDCALRPRGAHPTARVAGAAAGRSALWDPEQGSRLRGCRRPRKAQRARKEPRHQPSLSAARPLLQAPAPPASRSGL